MAKNKIDSNKRVELLEQMGSIAKPNQTNRIAKAEFTGERTTNVWTDAIKSMNKPYGYDEFVTTVQLCRFFYRTEPVVSTVINKFVEIGINGLNFSKNNLTDNEFRVFTSLEPKLLDFAEQMAIEYLLSGLVAPEIGYSKINDKNYIFSLGVKKYSSLELPDSMWIRDPKSITIYTHWLSDKPTYYVKIPANIVSFIQNKGKFSDGKEDIELYKLLVDFYPEFVAAINKGLTEVPLENNLIFRRRYTSDNAYPIPYIASSLDALQHKRKLRRMDYSLIDKVISAILHVKVGSDDFPVTESEEDQGYLDELRSQMRMRGNTEQLMERIFQLFTNHTVELNWVFPDSSILLDVEKYSDINQEILFGLGFPRVLITGEAAKTGTSDPELAMIAPIKTMENFRKRIIEVIRNICREVALRNGFKNPPHVEFEALNLHSFKDFIEGLGKLYDASALSRTTLAKVYGKDFNEELDLLEAESKELKSRNLPGFGPTPFGSNQPAVAPTTGKPATGAPVPVKKKPAQPKTEATAGEVGENE